MIRLQRVGKRNKSAFRLVVTDRRNGPQSGKFLEVLGHHDPHHNITKCDADRVQHWMSVGARPSPTAHNLLVSEKIIEGKKVNVLPRKSPIKSETEEEAPTEEAPAGEAAQEAAPESEKESEEPTETEAPAEKAAAEEEKESQATA